MAMPQETIISFRTSIALKTRLKEDAARKKKSVSTLINERLEAAYSDPEHNVEPPSEESWKAFRKYVGGGNLRGQTPSPKEIDEICYGKR